VDRLEKALEKARDIRNRAVPDAAAPGATAAIDKGYASSPKVEPERARAGGLQSRTIEVEEDHLEFHRVVARQKRNQYADVFRILRTRVLQSMAKSDMRTIAVTSANYGDGKTTIATNLALSIALDVKQTVLLVDLDFRRPSLGKVLGLPPDRGLSDVFLDGAAVGDCLVRLAVDRLSVLPINRPVENSSELLGTPQMAAIAAELKSRYPDRLVIYDMPPLLAQDDTIAFLPHVDGVLLVVRDGVTPTEDVLQAGHLLEGTNLIGTVLNNCADTSVNRG
jgi:Mrp family chromosome partitioning ATPase